MFADHVRAVTERDALRTTVSARSPARKLTILWPIRSNRPFEFLNCAEWIGFGLSVRQDASATDVMLFS